MLSRGGSGRDLRAGVMRGDGSLDGAPFYIIYIRHTRARGSGGPGEGG